MSSTETRNQGETATRSAGTVDMKLEVVVIPVSDVDRAKAFYAGLGWRLDADFASATASGSSSSRRPARDARSVRHGLTRPRPARPRACTWSSPTSRRPAPSWSRTGRRRQRGVPRDAGRAVPARRRRPRRPAPTRTARSYSLVRLVRRPGRQRLGAAGDHHPAARPGRRRRRPRSGRRPSWRRRCGGLRRRTAGTRSGSARRTRTGRTGTPSTWCASRPGRSCRR